MRKVEQQMITAINAAPAYGCSVKNMGNTSVQTDHFGGIHVYLHGNCIAIRHRGEGWQITLSGWNTATTRSRLTAIGHSFSPAYIYGVGTRKGQAEIRYASHVRPIPDNEWVVL